MHNRFSTLAPYQRKNRNVWSHVIGSDGSRFLPGWLASSHTIICKQDVK
jgi:hypothetical protein